MPYAPFGSRSGGSSIFSSGSSVSSTVSATSSSSTPTTDVATNVHYGNNNKPAVPVEQQQQQQHSHPYCTALAVDEIEVPVEETTPAAAAQTIADIRRALRAQLAHEDALMEQAFTQRQRQQQQQSSPSNKSVAATEVSASTASPRRHDNEDEDENEEHQQVEPPELNEEGVLFQKAEQHRDEKETVVLYNDGATELFRCIEEADWERAGNVLRQHPQQAAVWVVSTGTVGTTFDWSLWKRLPLHEAARRQAPVDFLTRLVRAHPAAAKAATQFGELPLHLAVECGAAPAAVNLLAVTHWKGCHSTDQSGRTPLDILQEADLLLDPLEHQAVNDALQATADTYREILSEHAVERAALKAQHAAGLAAVRLQHDADLAEEQDQQEKLLRQVAALQQQLQQHGATISQQQRELQQLTRDEQYWKERVELLKQENLRWKQACNQEQETVKVLRQTVADRDDQAAVLADRIVDLQTAITRLARWHQTTVQSQLQTVNRSFRAALQELSGFTTTLTDHEEDLQALLVEMGVDDGDDDEQLLYATAVVASADPSLRASDDAMSAQLHGADDLDDDEEEVDDDDVVTDSEAVMRAAQAASDVL